MIWELFKKFVVGFILGFLCGAYAVTHIDETLHGYATVKDRIVKAIHKEPICPEQWTCVKTVENPIPTPNP